MSYDENPADNDLHGECRNEIHQLQNLLGQVYDQCGNHRAADRRHCLSPGLRDEIQGYLQAAGHQRAIAEQENKGDDMAETHDSELRKRLFLLGKLTNVENDAGKPIQWGQVRIKYLEQHLQELLVDIKKLELENENLSKTILTLSAPPMLTSLESDEEIHQQRRRERMLDEITLFLVRNELHRSNLTMDEFGCGIRKSAMKLCDGINEADAKH